MDSQARSKVAQFAARDSRLQFGRLNHSDVAARNLDE